MNIQGIIGRFLFYGLFLLLFVSIFYFLKPNILGATAYKIFLVMAVVSGSIQSINFLVIRKISAIQKIENIGFWARWRLRSRIEIRSKTAFTRSLVGVVMALITGCFSAWMNILDSKIVPFWGLGAATGFALISIMMLFLTLYEFYVVTTLENEINEKAEKQIRKDEALKSIKGDNEKI